MVDILDSLGQAVTSFAFASSDLCVNVSVGRDGKCL